MAVTHDMTMMDDDDDFFHLRFLKPGSIAFAFRGVYSFYCLSSYRALCIKVSLFFSFVVVVMLFFFFIRFPVLELTMTLDEVFFFPFFPFFFFLVGGGIELQPIFKPFFFF